MGDMDKGQSGPHPTGSRGKHGDISYLVSQLHCFGSSFSPALTCRAPLGPYPTLHAEFPREALASCLRAFAQAVPFVWSALPQRVSGISPARSPETLPRSPDLSFSRAQPQLSPICRRAPPRDGHRKGPAKGKPKASLRYLQDGQNLSSRSGVEFFLCLLPPLFGPGRFAIFSFPKPNILAPKRMGFYVHAAAVCLLPLSPHGR